MSSWINNNGEIGPALVLTCDTSGVHFLQYLILNQRNFSANMILNVKNLSARCYKTWHFSTCCIFIFEFVLPFVLCVTWRQIKVNNMHCSWHKQGFEVITKRKLRHEITWATLCACLFSPQCPSCRWIDRLHLKEHSASTCFEQTKVFWVKL